MGSRRSGGIVGIGEALVRAPTRRAVGLAQVGGVAALAATLAGCEQPWTSELVSVNGAGTAAVGVIEHSAGVSADGTKVLFVTSASGLGPVDTNGDLDVYVRDLDAGTTTLVSSNAAGTDSADGYSWMASFSRDGSKIVFQSGATDLVAGGPPAPPGISAAYVHDLASGTTVPVSLDTGGQFVESRSYTGSPDGDRVAFVTTDRIDPRDTGSGEDVYLRDVAAGTTTLVSVDATGGAALDTAYDPAFSPDGERLTFETLDGLMLADLAAGTAELVAPDGGDVVFSADGSTVAYTSAWDGHGVPDANGTHDVFVLDLAAGAGDATLVSVAAAGAATGNNSSYVDGISADGTKVLFSSHASDLVAGDANNAGDVFLRDMATGTTTLVSVNGDGTASGNGASIRPALSDDATKVVFVSSATNLGPVDTTLCTRWDFPRPPLPPRKYEVSCPDIYVRDLAAGETTLVSTRADRLHAADEESTRARFLPGSSDEVVFVTRASDVDAVDGQYAPDIYVAQLSDRDGS